MDKIRVNLYDFLLCLSNAQDMVIPDLSNHHQKVAYLAFRIAEQAKLPIERQKNVIFAALVHDIGALSVDERLELIENEPLDKNNHAFKGAKLLDGFKPLENVMDIIKYHHIPWDNGKGSTYMGEEVSLESHIIHLADRTCAMLLSNKNVLTNVPEILSKINQRNNTIFEPQLVKDLIEISYKEYIWLDLVSSRPVEKIPDIGLHDKVVLEIDDIIDFSRILSQIIDFRSRFTARHSAGVAVTAERLAYLAGFSPIECKMMLIAGYLHDLGKLAIDNSLLEKPAKLNVEEFNEIRTHTYHTYQLLSTISKFDTIKEWASFHHERLDGKGYPFHIKGDYLPLGSRVMAVADVFTAITENRPYRKGMDDSQATQILNGMGKNEVLDEKVVGILLNEFHSINELRESAQREAADSYENFLLNV